MKKIKVKKIKPKKTSRGVVVVALWMSLAPLTFLFTKMHDGPALLAQIAQRPTVEVTAYGLIVLCAIGLLLFQEWAWWASIVLFSFYGIANLVIVYFKIVPCFPQIIEFYTLLYSFTPEAVRGILLTLIITSIIWPVVVVLFLLHPRTKSKFHVTDLKKFKETIGEIKPG